MTDPAQYGDVGVVLITRNEEAAIGKVLTDIGRALPGANIYVVDDSDDRTAEIAASLGAVVSAGPRRGFGPAMHQALMTPTEPIVATIDADDTYPTDAFPALVALIREGFDVAGTDRLGKRRPPTMPRSNYLANWFFSMIATVRAHQRIRDVHSGQRAYSRDLLHGVSWRFDMDAFPIDLIFVPAILGFRVTEVWIDYRERVGVTTLDRWSSGKASLRRR